MGTIVLLEERTGASQKRAEGRERDEEYRTGAAFRVSWGHSVSSVILNNAA